MPDTAQQTPMSICLFHQQEIVLTDVSKWPVPDSRGEILQMPKQDMMHHYGFDTQCNFQERLKIRHHQTPSLVFLNTSFRYFINIFTWAVYQYRKWQEIQGKLVLLKSVYV